MMKIMEKGKKSGAIALITLLIMIVILTIGLSLASRSITDIRISQDEKEALRAFSAAEAGVEDILARSPIVAGTYEVNVGDLRADVTVVETGEGATRTVEKGETMTVLLDGADPSTTQLTIRWINEDDSTEISGNEASIEVVVYRDDYTFSRYAFNANGRSDRGNGFEEGEASGDNFHSQKEIDIDLGAGDKLVRIRPLYNKTTIKINSNGTLPVQQYNITSQAVSESEKISKMIVFRTIPALPPIFDYVLFSEGDLSN